MPYIDYAQIKHLIPLDTIIDSLNLRRRGRSIHCPNTSAHSHGDKTPSAYISSTRQSWHCHACGAGGSVIDLIAIAHEIPRHNAALFLQSHAGLPCDHRSNPFPPAPAPTQDSTPSSPPSPTLRVTDFLLNAQRLLTLQSPGHLYLTKRGLSLAIAQLTGLGFAPRTTWLNHRGNGQPRLVAPLTWPDGTLATLYGRSTVDCHKLLKHDLLPGPKGLFNPAALTAPTLILTEGIFDALSVMAAGKPAAALCGLSIRDAWWREIPAQVIILAVDADHAGQERGQVLAANATQAGKQVIMLHANDLEGHKDLNEHWTTMKRLPSTLQQT